MPRLFNTDIARTMIMNESDAITRRFMIAVNYYLGVHIHNQSLLEHDFDAAFFMDVIRNFFREHEFIRDILDGKEINSFEPDEDDR